MKKMRGSVHIVGNPCDIDSTFETGRPQPNPPKQTYYRRAVYQLALERLRSIVHAIEDHDTQHTGKVYRNEQGEAIGRGKGIMPSLAKEFPEVRYWTKGPALLAKTIREAKTPLYFQLLQDAVHQVEGTAGEQLELFVMSAPRAQLDEIPPVIYPAHKGTARCKHCRSPHSSALHRFHLRGSYSSTHPGAEEARHRKKERDRDRERWSDKIPF
jgi:hypothetical protein